MKNRSSHYDVFCKTIALTIFLSIKRSYLQFQENAWKIFLNKFTFQVFFQGFCLDFKLLPLFILDFQEHVFSEHLFFSPLHVDWPKYYATTDWISCRVILDESVDWLLILFTFLGCLRLTEYSFKIWGTMLMG